MSFADKLLSREELDRLSNAIAEAEKKTSGEIRLMIVKNSSKFPDLFRTLALIFFALILFLEWWFWPELIFNHFYGGFSRYGGTGSVFLSLAFLLSLVFAAIFQRFDFVKRLLTRPSVLAQWVWLRAELEFHREGMGKTEDRTGILILLSLFERRAVVLADKGINEKLDKDTWQNVVDSVIDGIKKGQLADNLELAIKQCGNHLAKHFPIKPGDTNELSNTVIVKE
jgi:putative membrane protein